MAPYEEVDSLYGYLSSRFARPPKDFPKSLQIEELQAMKEKTEKELEEARTALFGSFQSISELKDEQERLKKQAEEIVNHDQIISQKKADLENELTILEKAKVNSHDEELVEKTKFQYRCLRNMTQVRFTYNKSDDDTIEGYVFNNTTKKVIAFNFNLSELNIDQVRERLMKLMKDASHKSYTSFT